MEEGLVTMPSLDHGDQKCLWSDLGMVTNACSMVIDAQAWLPMFFSDHLDS